MNIECVASYPDLPTHMQTYMRNNFIPQKVGRIGQFGDVMI